PAWSNVGAGFAGVTALLRGGGFRVRATQRRGRGGRRAIPANSHKGRRSADNSADARGRPTPAGHLRWTAQFRVPPWQILRKSYYVLPQIPQWPALTRLGTSRSISSLANKRARPRCKRDRMVPTGQSKTRAASS